MKMRIFYTENSCILLKINEVEKRKTTFMMIITRHNHYCTFSPSIERFSEGIRLLMKRSF